MRLPYLQVTQETWDLARSLAYLNRALTSALARTARRYVRVASGYGHYSRAAFDRGELPDYEWARLSSTARPEVSADARRIVDLLAAHVPAARRQDVSMFLACAVAPLLVREVA